MPFVKGQSGCPTGKPKGTKNRKSIILSELTRDSHELVELVKAKAREGDAACIALWLSRLEPPLKATAAKVVFEIDPDGDLLAQGKQIVAAIGSGALDPETGGMLIASLNKLGELEALQELKREVEELKARLA